MPVSYACDALKDITVKGFGLSNLIPQIVALLTFIVLFFILNIAALKKYRRIPAKPFSKERSHKRPAVIKAVFKIYLLFYNFTVHVNKSLV
jgi:hypothetical protein